MPIIPAVRPEYPVLQSQAWAQLSSSEASLANIAEISAIEIELRQAELGHIAKQFSSERDLRQ